jgi:hypothetical protein
MLPAPRAQTPSRSPASSTGSSVVPPSASRPSPAPLPPSPPPASLPTRRGRQTNPNPHSDRSGGLPADRGLSRPTGRRPTSAPRACRPRTGGAEPAPRRHPKKSEFRVGWLVIAFERQHVIGVGFHHLFSDGFLAIERVHRDDAAGQFQRPQQGGRGGDLVAFVVYFDLAQHQPVGTGPSNDQMNRAAGPWPRRSCGGPSCRPAPPPRPRPPAAAFAYNSKTRLKIFRDRAAGKRAGRCRDWGCRWAGPGTCASRLPWRNQTGPFSRSSPRRRASRSGRP